MQYIGDVFRPPSEAGSLLIQVTLGCAWNKCTFCTMYREKPFQVRRMQDIEADLAECSPYSHRYRRVFLCDGNALALSAEKLEHILGRVRHWLPNIDDIRMYASTKDILGKTVAELQNLRALGLTMVFTGLESGSDRILAAVNKGETKQQMIDAAHRLKQAGIQQSISIISGLGGTEYWQEHILETADALNQMQPQYVGLLALTPPGWAGMDDLTAPPVGPLKEPSAEQAMQEMLLLAENLQLDNCLFTSAHVSNYSHLRAHLPAQKQQLVQAAAQQLAAVRENPPPQRSRFLQL